MTPRQFHEVVMSFPQTEAAASYGLPAYKAFGKFFTRLRAEDASIVLAQIDFDERDMLCAAEPETFHFTEHYRSSHAILARLKTMDAKRLRLYLTRQWRHNAPKRWLKTWEEGEGATPEAIKAASNTSRKKTPRKKTPRKKTSAMKTPAMKTLARNTLRRAS